jgi:single-strand DNA-binding protein
MLNKVFLIGNLGKDPEIRHFENGSSVAKMSLATNESYKDREGEWQTITEWHDIVMWRRLAERAERDLKKGSLIFVEGKISKRKWQDKEGNDRYSTDINALSFKLLEKREASATGFIDNFPSATDEFPTVKEQSSEQKTNLPDISAEDDDLPF